MSENINKVWKTAAQFKTYAEADAYRNELFGKHELIKVKRGRDVYRVKVWDPPVAEEGTKKVKNKFKKGDNNSRRKKSDNKKVRSR